MRNFAAVKTQEIQLAKHKDKYMGKTKKKAVDEWASAFSTAFVVYI